MGVYREVLIEPFIKIKLQYKLYESTEMMCENKHPHYHGECFCSKCGGEIKAVELKQKAIIGPYELIGNENFWHLVYDNYMYLFSNCHAFDDSEPNDNEIKVITSEKIKMFIQVFKAKHRDDIILLETKLGEKVIVEFGVMHHVS